MTALNAAFNEARSGKLERAVALLDLVSYHIVPEQVTSDLGKLVTLDLDSLPGIASWVDEESVV